MARGFDTIRKREIEFAMGRIDNSAALFMLVPEETRPPGRYHIKSGPGTLSECTDFICLDVLGRKIKRVSGDASRCRGYMFDFPFIEKPYFHFLVPIGICRKCCYYRKKNQTRYNYPVCGVINHG
jgi:hypothetical protein